MFIRWWKLPLPNLMVFFKFLPGPGLGGRCIPIDPFYLSWKAKKFNVDTEFIKLAGKINRSMPGWVIKKIFAIL